MASLKRAKTFIRFTTQHVRSMVHTVLEPHPTTGLRIQDIYHRIHELFPQAKEKEEFLPPIVKNIHIGGEKTPPHLCHPIRSMRFLKKTVLPEMAKMGEVQQIYMQQGIPDRDGIRLDLVKYPRNKNKGEEQVFIPTDMLDRAEWRWRLVPGHTPNDIPDPKLEDVLHAQSATSFGGLHGVSKKRRKRSKAEYIDTQIKTYGRRLH